MTAFRPRHISARAARGSAYTVPGPSLFEGRSAFPRSILRPLTKKAAAELAEVQASWARHAAASEFPVWIHAKRSGSSVEWRSAPAGEVAA